MTHSHFHCVIFFHFDFKTGISLKFPLLGDGRYFNDVVARAVVVLGADAFKNICFAIINKDHYLCLLHDTI